MSGLATVQIWNADTGEIEHILKGHQDFVVSVAFSRDDSRIVSASRDATVRTWNIEAQRIPEHISHSMNNHTRRIWDTVRVTTMMKPCIMEMDFYPVNYLSFSPEGSSIVCASRDTLRLWRTSTAELIHILPHSEEMVCVVFSSCGWRVAAGSNDKVHIWNAITGVKESVLTGELVLGEDPSDVTVVAFSPCDSHIVSASSDGTLCIWNPGTKWQEVTLIGHSASVVAVGFSHDGSRIASGSLDSTIRVWNVATEEAESIIEYNHNRVPYVAFSHDNSRVVSGYFDGTITIWDITTQELTELHQLPDGS